METSKVRYVCLFLSVTILLAHWNLILFCFSLKQRTFNAFPLTLDERYEIQQLILGRKVYSIFAWWSSSNIRSLFLFLWFQVISFYSVPSKTSLKAIIILVIWNVTPSILSPWMFSKCVHIYSFYYVPKYPLPSTSTSLIMSWTSASVGFWPARRIAAWSSWKKHEIVSTYSKVFYQSPKYSAEDKDFSLDFGH